MTRDPRNDLRNESRDRSLRSPQATGSATWQPQIEVLALDCEITAYAPDGDEPLF
jgi:hypothetical protein